MWLRDLVGWLEESKARATSPYMTVARLVRATGQDAHPPRILRCSRFSDGSRKEGPRALPCLLGSVGVWGNLSTGLDRWASYPGLAGERRRLLASEFYAVQVTGVLEN